MKATGAQVIPLGQHCPGCAPFRTLFPWGVNIQITREARRKPSGGKKMEHGKFQRLNKEICHIPPPSLILPLLIMLEHTVNVGPSCQTL